MNSPTATETLGMYTGIELDKTVDPPFPFIIPDRKWEATRPTWDQRHEAQVIYQEVVSRRFQQLVDRWSEDTLDMSSIEDMVEHPSYSAIIDMGEAAVPLLLRELEKAPNYWFPALTAITGVNPIPEEARGRLIEMTEAWLEWGRGKGHC